MNQLVGLHWCKDAIKIESFVRIKSTVMRKVSKEFNTVFRFCSKINTTYQGLLRATSILTLWQQLSPQAPCVVVGLKSVIWSLWTLCASTPKVWCAEICSIFLNLIYFTLTMWMPYLLFQCLFAFPICRAKYRFYFRFGSKAKVTMYLC